MTGAKAWKRKLFGAIVLGMLAAPAVFAESGCSGSTYTNPSCSGNCSLANCQDVSFGQDGSSFQCCPPNATTPELPIWIGPFTAAILGLGLFFGVRFFKRRNRRTT